jgi:hypothetical protein
MFFDERRVNEDQITLSAKADLAKVQQMIDQGQWVQAQNQLAEVSSTVESMDDGNRRQDLMDQVNLLNTRVESRDPNATLPPSSPPGVFPSAQTKPPSAPAASPPPVAGTTTPSSSSAPPAGRHHHHGQTSTDPSVAPSTGP